MTRKKKFILILSIVLIVIVVYSMIFTDKHTYTMAVDKAKSKTNEYSNVVLNIAMIKLPFNRALVYGKIKIDDLEMPLGTTLYGNYQIIKTNGKYDIIFYYFNPRYSSKDADTNISTGLVSLNKNTNRNGFTYANIFVIRTKVNTTMTQSFVLCGELIEPIAK